MTRFSIITPSFRQLEWLRLCVGSVADQTQAQAQAATGAESVEVEHLVQDAGTPGIEEVRLQWQAGRTTARRAAAETETEMEMETGGDESVQSPPPLRTAQASRPVQQPRHELRVFVEKDDGMYDAINRGLRRARGEILAWLNCDEQYLEGALARVAEFFQRRPEVEVLFGDAILVDAKGRPLSYRRAILPRRLHTRWVHLNTLSCATFFRRSVVERGHLFDPRWRMLGDTVWVDGLLAAGVRMDTLPEPLAAFTFTGENLSGSARARQEEKELRGGEWKRALVPLVSLAHRVRKWRAGAYRKHRVEMAIYTLDSPDVRKRFVAPELGYHWPEYGAGAETAGR